jgi:hypothetical protein
MPWDVVGKVLAVVLSAGTGLYRFRGSIKPRARANLKSDLEILKLLESSERPTPF